jgi:hypothetical protein
MKAHQILLYIGSGIVITLAASTFVMNLYNSSLKDYHDNDIEHIDKRFDRVDHRLERIGDDVKEILKNSK